MTHEQETVKNETDALLDIDSKVETEAKQASISMSNPFQTLKVYLLVERRYYKEKLRQAANDTGFNLLKEFIAEALEDMAVKPRRIVNESTFIFLIACYCFELLRDYPDSQFHDVIKESLKASLAKLTLESNYLELILKLEKQFMEIEAVAMLKPCFEAVLKQALLKADADRFILQSIVKYPESKMIALAKEALIQYWHRELTTATAAVKHYEALLAEYKTTEFAEYIRKHLKKSQERVRKQSQQEEQAKRQQAMANPPSTMKPFIESHMQQCQSMVPLLEIPKDEFDEAIILGDIAKAEEILSKDPKRLDKPNPITGQTALGMAVVQGNSQLVDYLYDKRGASLNVTIGAYEIHSPILAARQQPVIAERLMEASIELANKQIESNNEEERAKGVILLVHCFNTCAIQKLPWLKDEEQIIAKIQKGYTSLTTPYAIILYICGRRLYDLAHAIDEIQHHTSIATDTDKQADETKKKALNDHCINQAKVSRSRILQYEGLVPNIKETSYKKQAMRLLLATHMRVCKIFLDRGFFREHCVILNELMEKFTRYNLCHEQVDKDAFKRCKHAVSNALLSLLSQSHRLSEEDAQAVRRFIATEEVSCLPGQGRERLEILLKIINVCDTLGFNHLIRALHKKVDNEFEKLVAKTDADYRSWCNFKIMLCKVFSQQAGFEELVLANYKQALEQQKKIAKPTSDDTQCRICILKGYTEVEKIIKLKHERSDATVSPSPKFMG